MTNNATSFHIHGTLCDTVLIAAGRRIREQHWSFSFLFKWCFALLWNLMFGVFIIYVSFLRM
jgi:hypothetical protein